MESEPRSATGHINRGIAFHAAGEIDAAREQFAEAILDDPGNEHAWLWLAETCDDPAEQRYCLDRALKLNPDSAARARQAELATVKGVVPPVVADVDKHPLPPSLAPREHPLRARIRGLPGPAWPATIRSRSAQAFRGRWWMWALPGMTLILLAGWLLVAQPWESDQPWVVAVVGPMTGPEAGVGTEMMNGAELALDMIAGDQGPRIDLVVFDTQDDPDQAEATARRIVADSRFVAVIDFGSSTASLAAAPVYADAGLAVISGRASPDALEQYAAHFRLTVNISTEGALLAQYVAFGLDYERASVIVGPGSYEQAISEAFSTQFSAEGTIAQTWTLASDQRDASIAALVQGLEESSDPGIVLLALREADAHDVLLAVRRAGLTPIMIGTEPQSTEDFGRSFANEPEEQATPGFFTENLYAAVPILYDGIGGDAVAVALRYQQVYGTEPGWRAAKGYDAALVVSSAIRAGRLEHDTAADRAQVIANLQAIGNPDVALRGISGPLYFNERGFVPQGLSLGEFVGGLFVSAPIQYRLVTDPGQFDLEADLASGDAFQLDGDTFREFRVVYVGVEMIELRDLQVTRQTYAADFFIYFRYFGDDKVVDVVFTNATSDLHLAEPLVTKTDATGMTYRLYRVQGEFGEPMDFSDYPWDEHLLTIRLQNRTEEDTELLYVPDPAIVTSSQAERQGSGFDLSRPFEQIPSWHVAFVDFAHVSISAASDDYDSPSFVQYSEFRVLLDIERDIGKFLVKNLLPLAMLTIMTYISMWFPPEEARTRTTFSITALLTAAVMLNTISSRLPDIGYTVAIEWGFYVFIGVVALLALLNMAVLHSFRAKHYARVKRLDTCIRIFFPVAVLSTIAVYVVKFG